MRVELEQQARIDASASTWTRLRLLPHPVLLLALLFLLSALAPAVAELNAVLVDADGSTWLGALAWHPTLVSGLSLAAAFGALLFLERPQGLSPVAYLRQLRDRLAAVQADFDGALRRRAHEEEEKRHASEPHPSEP
jgi:hypothetical protein